MNRKRLGLISFLFMFLVSSVSLFLFFELFFLVGNHSLYFLNSGLDLEYHKGDGISEDCFFSGDSQEEPPSIPEEIPCKSKFYKEKSDKFRIIAIGGSTTFCHTPLEECWPYLLEAKLNNIVPDKFEVINLGCPGYTIKDLIGNTITEPNGYLSLDPDLVVIAPVWNDLMNGFNFPENHILNLHLRKNFLVRKTALGYYLYRAYYSIIFQKYNSQFFEKYAQDKFYSQENITEARKRLEYLQGTDKSIPYISMKLGLRELISIYDDENIPLIVLTLPSVYTKDYNYSETRSLMDKFGLDNSNFPKETVASFLIIERLDRQIISEESRHANVELIDFTQYFYDHYPSIHERVVFFQDESHFNARGNKLLAELIINSQSFSSLIGDVE